MRCVYLIALATWVAMPTVSTPADEPTADQRLAMGRNRLPPPVSGSDPPPPGLFGDNALAHFRLVSGKLQLDPMRYRKGSDDFSGEAFQESISVANASGVPSVYYRYEDGYQRVQLIAEHGRTLRIESTLQATGEQATLVQHASGNISWTVRRSPRGDSNLDLQISGPTLLHIIGQDEAGFRVHVNALIGRMLQGRDLIELAGQTESYLLRNAEQLMAISRERVQQLITQLGARQCSKRRAAMRQLVAMGTAVTPHLAAALEQPNLDAEQIARLKVLLDRSPRFDEDTPASLACLLSADQAHWQLMAKRMTHSEWLAANNHVRRCGLETLRR